MKKLIILSVLVLSFLAQPAMAYTPLTGADNRTKATNEIFADLQSQIDYLKFENQQLKNQINQSGGGTSDISLAGRMSVFEQRLAVVEEAMAGLNQWIRDVFRLFERIFRVRLL